MFNNLLFFNKMILSCWSWMNFTKCYFMLLIPTFKLIVNVVNVVNVSMLSILSMLSFSLPCFGKKDSYKSWRIWQIWINTVNLIVHFFFFNANICSCLFLQAFWLQSRMSLRTDDTSVPVVACDRWSNKSHKTPSHGTLSVS